MDPENTRQHEAKIWKHYIKATEHNNDYFKEKCKIKPKATDAHIIFRSMEGKQRAYNAYDISYFQRYFI